MSSKAGEEHGFVRVTIHIIGQLNKKEHLVVHDAARNRRNAEAELVIESHGQHIELACRGRVLLDRPPEARGQLNPRKGYGVPARDPLRRGRCPAADR